MQSDIQQFYKDKTVFVTGGTGFLGKVIIEKLLRSTDVKRIYFLVRKKKDENVESRFEVWKNERVFDVLLKAKPEALNLMTPISGDCSAPDLGLSEEDRKILTSEVEVVIHSAASIRFVEPLHNALNINTRGTRLMIQLAKEMKGLKAFVHVSTAYSNCITNHIQERFYPENLTCPAAKVLEFNETLSPELLNSMAPALIGKFPNTYVYTKALAEQLIQMEGQDLPICIFRPAIIMANFKEPMSGWIDNPHGVVALIYGSAHGILRLVYTKPNAHAMAVPGDYCANVAVASGWQVSKNANPSSFLAAKSLPPIYAFAPDKSNTIDYRTAVQKSLDNNHKSPVTKTIWYPFAHFTTCPFLFKLGCIFYHLIPGFFTDLVLRLQGRKPILMKIYPKIHEALILLYPFSGRTIVMDTNNTTNIWNDMSAEDRAIFPFDMANLNWDDYFSRIYNGMREFLFKESWDTLEKAKRRLFWLRILHRLLEILVYIAVGTLIWTLFLNNNQEIKTEEVSFPPAIIILPSLVS